MFTTKLETWQDGKMRTQHWDCTVVSPLNESVELETHRIIWLPGPLIPNILQVKVDVYSAPGTESGLNFILSRRQTTANREAIRGADWCLTLNVQIVQKISLVRTYEKERLIRSRAHRPPCKKRGTTFPVSWVKPQCCFKFVNEAKHVHVCVCILRLANHGSHNSIEVEWCKILSTRNTFVLQLLAGSRIFSHGFETACQCLSIRLKWNQDGKELAAMCVFHSDVPFLRCNSFEGFAALWFGTWLGFCRRIDFLSNANSFPKANPGKPEHTMRIRRPVGVFCGCSRAVFWDSFSFTYSVVQRRFLICLPLKLGMPSIDSQFYIISWFCLCFNSIFFFFFFFCFF